MVCKHIVRPMVNAIMQENVWSQAQYCLAETQTNKQKKTKLMASGKSLRTVAIFPAYLILTVSLERSNKKPRSGPDDGIAGNDDNEALPSDSSELTTRYMAVTHTWL